MGQLYGAPYPQVPYSPAADLGRGQVSDVRFLRASPIAIGCIVSVSPYWNVIPRRAEALTHQWEETSHMN